MQSSAAGVTAHVLRRLTFGPHPGQIEQWQDLGANALIESLLSGTVLPIEPSGEIDFSTDEGWGAPMVGWFSNMKNPRAGLHEKMTWFWHSHLTSSIAKSEPLLMYRQHRTVRRLALGNFRELVSTLTTDGAMLHWLDGDGSVGDAPNENFSRELLELFVLGPGNYSEADVRAGAKALAGWRVNWPSLDVAFESASAHRGTLDYLGRSGTFGPTELVDAACSHPSCAPFIAGKLHRHLVGSPPSPARLARLARVFADNDLEILPLVREIVTHPSFLAEPLHRVKAPIEWLIGAAAALDRLDDVEVWAADRLGQMPLSPPDPSGWPDGPIWLSTQQQLDRLSILNWWWVAPDSVAGAAATVDGVLARCGLHDVSATTRTALAQAEADAEDWFRPTALYRLALTSPEFQLS